MGKNLEIRLPARVVNLIASIFSFTGEVFQQEVNLEVVYRV